MRADIRKFIAAYGKPGRPSEIRQEPLDGDPGHYARLLALEEGALPAVGDFGEYANDIAYMEKVQPELFAFLLPICLDVWRHDLMHNHRSDYAGWVEVFISALARRPLLEDCLTEARAEAVMAFMREGLLDRIDREDSLSHAGEHATAHAWFYRLGSFAVTFPALESLWRVWRRFETPGQAIAALQYVSCLMYDDNANPIFAPRTAKHGGGPPGLWETDGQIFHESWKLENVVFFVDNVTPDYLRDALTRAAQALEGVVESDVPAQMISDFERQRPLLAHRLRALPEIVSIPLNATLEWPPLP